MQIGHLGDALLSVIDLFVFINALKNKLEKNTGNVLRKGCCVNKIYKLLLPVLNIINI